MGGTFTHEAMTKVWTALYPDGDEASSLDNTILRGARSGLLKHLTPSGNCAGFSSTVVNQTKRTVPVIARHAALLFFTIHVIQNSNALLHGGQLPKEHSSTLDSSRTTALNFPQRRRNGPFILVNRFEKIACPGN